MKYNIILISLILFSFGVSVANYANLPNQIPTHWNIRGEIDAYSSKAFGAFFSPVLMLALVVFFKIVPNFDPKKEKYKLFEPEWNMIQIGLVGFFAYLHLLIIRSSLDHSFAVTQMMMIGFGALWVFMGNFMSKIRQNYFVGIKTPWSLASEENWNKTHRFASWSMVAGGVVILSTQILKVFPPALIFVVLIGSAILPVLYSFLFFKHWEKWLNYILIGCLVCGGIIFALRLSSPEDKWICQDGQWIQHGQPSASIPDKPCIKLNKLLD